jgi:3-hydroxybutyrate dehydrogenase
MSIKEPEIKPNDILKLEDKDFNQDTVCLVSGCATGIGRATAIAAAANKLTVAGLDVNEAEANKTRALVEESGGKMLFIKTDLLKDEDIEQAVSRASELGRIRYLANIAGLQHIDSVDNFPMEKYDLMQRLMLRAPFYLSQLVIRHMKKQGDGSGAIGNMASVHAHICTMNKPVYNITKFGLKALSQSISAEGQGRIRSFTVSSGFVKTPLALNQIAAQAKQRGITEEEVVSDTMMGKSRIKEMMAPIDVANLFIFGFSRFSKYLIGGDLLFDGGMVLTY